MRKHCPTDAQKETNRIKSMVRARVEHIFGAQAKMGGHIVRPSAWRCPTAWKKPYHPEFGIHDECGVESHYPSLNAINGR